MLQLRAVAIGSAVTVVLAGMSAALLGVSGGAPVILLSGVLGGVATAIAIGASVEINSWNTAHHSFVAAGLGGIIIFAVIFGITVVGDFPLADRDSTIPLLFATSPLVIPAFAVGGIVGGLVKHAVHGLIRRS